MQEPCIPLRTRTIKASHMHRVEQTVLSMAFGRTCLATLLWGNAFKAYGHSSRTLTGKLDSSLPCLATPCGQTGRGCCHCHTGSWSAVPQTIPKQWHSHPQVGPLAATSLAWTSLSFQPPSTSLAPLSSCTKQQVYKSVLQRSGKKEERLKKRLEKRLEEYIKVSQCARQATRKWFIRPINIQTR